MGALSRELVLAEARQKDMGGLESLYHEAQWLSAQIPPEAPMRQPPALWRNPEFSTEAMAVEFGLKAPVSLQCDEDEEKLRLKQLVVQQSAAPARFGLKAP